MHFLNEVEQHDDMAYDFSGSWTAAVLGIRSTVGRRAGRPPRGRSAKASPTSVGMATAQQWLAARYNRPGFENLFDFNVYALCGDGCMMEGTSTRLLPLRGTCDFQIFAGFTTSSCVEVRQRSILEPLRISPLPKAIRAPRNRQDSAKPCPQLSSTPALYPPGCGIPDLPSTH
jgi:hypothetical protein